MPAFGATASVHSETGGVAEKRVKTDRLWPAVLDSGYRLQVSMAIRSHPRQNGTA